MFSQSGVCRSGRNIFCCVLSMALGLVLMGVIVAQASSGYNLAPTKNLPQDVIYVNTHSIVRQVKPTFWGFSLDLIAFQNDFWAKDTQRVRPELLEWLRVFPLAIYRYPGGTPSNYFRWYDSVGVRAKRLPQKLVSWRAPQVVDFGFDEYMAFVQTANGTPWVTVNLHGDFDKELDIEKLSASSKQWAEYAHKKYPDLPVLKWELGNELYFSWSPQKYVSRSQRTMTAMTQSTGAGKFVSLLEDYNNKPYYPGLSLVEYNSIIANGFGEDVTEFVLHQYYGSISTVQERLGYICQMIATIKKVKKNRDMGIWITETGRWPPGEKKKNWNKSWWRSSSLEAAISVADYLIGTVQIPEVKGVMLHTLAGNSGPWSMFHVDKESHLHPSLVFLTLKLLRENLQSEVLFTKTVNAAGKSDVHSVAFSNKSQTKYSLWATNSSKQGRLFKLAFAGHGGEMMKGTMTYLSNRDINATNHKKYDQVLPVTSRVEMLLDGVGRSAIELPLNSISTFDFSFEVQKQ